MGDFFIVSGGNVQVTYDKSVNNARSESVLVANPADPDHMVGASKRFLNLYDYTFVLRAVVTTDGGVSWKDSSDLPLNSGWHVVSDPALAFDRDGNVLLFGFPCGATVAECFGFAVWSSSDGGMTWGEPLVLSTSMLADKDWAASDTNPTSPHYGNVYVVWMEAGLMFTRRRAGETTWRGVGSAPAGQGFGGAPAFAPDVAVAPDGTVHIVFLDGPTVKVASSTDGGESFGKAVVVADGITTTQSVTSLTVGGWAVLPGGRFRVETTPSVCAGPGGLVVAAWADYREGRARVYCSRSVDGGTTWDTTSGRPLLTGAAAPPDDQHDFHPQVVVDPGGRLGCSFYRFGPKSSPTPLIDVVFAGSSDAGASFPKTLVVTRRPWDPNVDAPLSDGGPGVTFIGDYFGLTATSNGFFPLWTDTRTGLQELFTANVQITNHVRLPSDVIMSGDIVRLIGALDEPSYTVVIRGGVITIIPGGPGPGPGPDPGPGPGTDQELARLEGRAREALVHLRLAVKELREIDRALDARQAAATRRAAKRKRNA